MQFFHFNTPIFHETKIPIKKSLKKKPARLTIAEMMIDPAFTVLTDEQKAGKKAGFTNEQFNRNDFESANLRLVSNNGFNPVNNHLGRGSNNNFTSSLPSPISDSSEIKLGRHAYTSGGEPTIDAGWLKEVVIPGKKPKKQNPPQSPTYFNHSNPNIPYWHTFPTVNAPYNVPKANVALPPNGFSSWDAYYAQEKYEWSITPNKVETGAIQSTIVGTNTKDFFEDEEARQRSEKFAFAPRNDNHSAFKTISERSDYYQWVDKQLEGKSKWFRAAAIVTQWNAVGAAELPNGPLLNDAAEKLLKEGNKELFAFNLRRAKGMIYHDRVGFGSFPEPNNNPIFVTPRGKKGKSLDYVLVQREQAELQYILTEYKKKNPISEVNSAIKSINRAMGLPGSPREVGEVMDEQFNVKKGQKAFDFDKYEDRVKLGQGIIDKLYK